MGNLSGTVLPGLGGALGKISGTVLPGLGSAFSGVFGFIAAHPIVLLIGAIVGLVTLIATKGDEIQARLKKVDDFLQNIFAKDWTEVFGPVLGGILNGFFAVFKEIWDAVYQIFDGVIDFIRGVFTGDWERAWDGVVKIFKGIFDGLETILKAPINSVIALINNHGLRHSFASLAYHLQIPEKIAMEIGGWADDGTMRKIYTHLSQKDIAKRAEEFSNFFSSKKQNGNENGNAD